MRQRNGESKNEENLSTSKQRVLIKEKLGGFRMRLLVRRWRESQRMGKPWIQMLAKESDEERKVNTKREKV